TRGPRLPTPPAARLAPRARLRSVDGLEAGLNRERFRHAAGQRVALHPHVAVDARETGQPRGKLELARVEALLEREIDLQAFADDRGDEPLTPGPEQLPVRCPLSERSGRHIAGSCRHVVFGQDAPRAEPEPRIRAERPARPARFGAVQHARADDRATVAEQIELRQRTGAAFTLTRRLVAAGGVGERGHVIPLAG